MSPDSSALQVTDTGQLDHDERLRLEALAQAIAYASMARFNRSPDEVVQTAQTFAAFIGGT